MNEGEGEKNEGEGWGTQTTRMGASCRTDEHSSQLLQRKQADLRRWCLQGKEESDGWTGSWAYLPSSGVEMQPTS